MEIKDIIGKAIHREVTFDRATMKDEERTVEVAFSSEQPYERWFGIEILSHEKSAVDMTRLGSGRANVLVNHNPGDYVGVVASARIDDDKMGRATVRFGNSERADSVWRDVKDGILSSVSVGYIPIEMKLTKKGKNTPDEYTVMKWEPFEVSLVTIPADHSVGVGRALNPAVSAIIKEPIMGEATVVDTQAGAAAEQQGTPAGSGARVADNAPNALELEKNRQRTIETLCRMQGIDDKTRDYFVSSGLAVDKVADDIMAIQKTRSEATHKADGDVGLSADDADAFSVSRALLAVQSGNWSNAKREAEISRALGQKLGKSHDPNTIYVPHEVQKRRFTLARELARHVFKRDLTVATSTAGGFLVATENVSFIELLRNRSVAFNMGAQRLSGLQGNVTVPRQTAGATAAWLSTEATAITESQQTFSQLALSPKTVGAYTEISRQLLLQSSPDAEAIVMSDLAQQVALAVDTAVLTGSGAAGQPTGITNTAGIGAVTGTSIGFAGILNFQEDVAAANVMPMAGGYVTTPAVAALLMQRVKFTSTASPLWEGNLWDGQMVGYKAMSSNQMAAATMLYGDWSKVLVGEWGVLEVVVNPYANFQAGIIGVRAMYTVDVGVRYAGAFSLASSIT